MPALVYPTCCVCGEIPSEGLYDGIRLTGKFLCSRCVNDIVAADLDSIEYEENVHRMKNILFRAEQPQQMNILQKYAKIE